MYANATLNADGVDNVAATADIDAAAGTAPIATAAISVSGDDTHHFAAMKCTNATADAYTNDVAIAARNAAEDDAATVPTSTATEAVDVSDAADVTANDTTGTPRKSDGLTISTRRPFASAKSLEAFNWVPWPTFPPTWPTFPPTCAPFTAVSSLFNNSRIGPWSRQQSMVVLFLLLQRLRPRLTLMLLIWLLLLLQPMLFQPPLQSLLRSTSSQMPL